MAARFRRSFRSRPKRDFVWVPNVTPAYIQSTTPLFSALVLPADWAITGGATSKDRCTYLGTRGGLAITSRLSAGGLATFAWAIGKDISSIFDPLVSTDYATEGDIWASGIFHFELGDATNRMWHVERIETKVKRKLQTAGEDAVELVTNSTVVNAFACSFNLHSLVDRT